MVTKESPGLFLMSLGFMLNVENPIIGMCHGEATDFITIRCMNGNCWNPNVSPVGFCRQLDYMSHTIDGPPYNRLDIHKMKRPAVVLLSPPDEIIHPRAIGVLVNIEDTIRAADGGDCQVSSYKAQVTLRWISRPKVDAETGKCMETSSDEIVHATAFEKPVYWTIG